jgi:hypothetical protein
MLMVPAEDPGKADPATPVGTTATTLGVGSRHRSRRRVAMRSLALLAGAGLLSLVLVATLSVLLLGSKSADPADPAVVAKELKNTVAAYFDALKNRDVERVRSLLIINPSDVFDYDTTTLLTAATLRNAGYTPPRQIQIGTVTTLPEHNQAQVEVSFQAGRTRQTLSLPLQREANAAGQRWLITGGTSALILPAVVGEGFEPTGIDTLLVAGTRVAWRQAISSPEKPLQALPGDYTITIPPHPVYECVPIRVAAGTTPDTNLVVKRRSS